jgi:cobalt-zinc-cadmium efflux system outer membrane protein
LVDFVDGLTSDEAVAVALWNNAGFQADCAELGFTHADLAEAAALPNPVVSLLLPAAPPKRVELAVSWGLWLLWQRPKRIRKARLDARRVADTLVQRGVDLARDVKVAHADRLLAADIEAVAVASDAEWAGLLRVAEARNQPGKSEELAIATIRADARAARADIEQALSGERRAEAQLRALLGAPNEVQLALEGEPTPASTGERREWTSLALAARLDLRAAALAIEAAGNRAGLERTALGQLVAVLGVARTDKKWKLGAEIQASLPVFDRGQGSHIRARAELEHAAWTYVALRREIERQVTDAHARLTEAIDALAAWDSEVVPAREEALRLARRAYEERDDAYLPAVDASRALTQARIRRAELVAQARRGAAELERAAGGRPRR